MNYLSLRNASRVRMDCNWMVKQADAMRAKVMASRLEGVVGLEARLAIKIACRAMDSNELAAALRAI